jgi:hypothetical protein
LQAGGCSFYFGHVVASEVRLPPNQCDTQFNPQGERFGRPHRNKQERIAAFGSDHGQPVQDSGPTSRLVPNPPPPPAAATGGLAHFGCGWHNSACQNLITDPASVARSTAVPRAWLRSARLPVLNAQCATRPWRVGTQLGFRLTNSWLARFGRPDQRKQISRLRVNHHEH